MVAFVPPFLLFMNPLVNKAIEAGIRIAPKVAKKLPSKINYNPQNIKMVVQDLSKGLSKAQIKGFWDFRGKFGELAKGREYFVRVGNKFVKRIKK